MSRMPCNNGSTHCHGICCVTGAQNNDKERWQKMFYAMYDTHIPILGLHYNTSYTFELILGELLNLVLFFLSGIANITKLCVQNI